MKKDIVRLITSNGALAAIYFLLTFVTASFSFLGIQVRIAEALILLCFFRKDYTIGITLGCLLANIFSPIGGWDILFGTLATLISCLLISFSKHLLIASLFPVVINGFVVGTELFLILNEPFWINVGFVCLGEALAVTLLGYLIFFALGKRNIFKSSIRANQNLDFKW